MQVLIQHLKLTFSSCGWSNHTRFDTRTHSKKLFTLLGCLEDTADDHRDDIGYNCTECVHRFYRALISVIDFSLIANREHLSRLLFIISLERGTLQAAIML